MNTAFVEHVRQSAILMPHALLRKYVKIEYVKLDAGVIPYVNNTRLASTTNVKVWFIIRLLAIYIILFFRTDPCDGFTSCGSCANCSVSNHVAQCSCPINSLGNPLVACVQPSVRCDGNCECDEAGYCARTCSSRDDCACGEACFTGKCRLQCTPQVLCTQGYICQNNICLPGCKSNTDCPSELACVEQKCQDPCLLPEACGTNALCRVSSHRRVCLCPDGYQGEPSKECVPYECRKDNDCEINKKCSPEGACKNPCLEQNACGVNAQCRVVDRKAQCSCTPGYIGNAEIECRQAKGEECAKNPCGENTSCKDVSGGYECICLPGCTGDALRGCVCEDHLVDLCRNKLCGTNAQCRVVNGKNAQCYCPPEFPIGDPTIECKLV